MSPQDFKARDRVIYVPAHAKGNIAHRDCDHGAVSRINSKYVFVKFDNSVRNFGWEGATSQACRPENLVRVPEDLVRVPEISEGE